MASSRREVHNQQPAPSGMQFNLVPLKDLARGIDLRSAESNVQDGYCEDLVNCDTVSTGQVAKRRGYEGYGGYVPYRVASITHDGYQIYFKLGAGVDLTGVESSPIVVYGRLPLNGLGGQYSKTDAAYYYQTFSTDVRDPVTGTRTLTKTASDTGATSPYLFVDVLRSNSDANASNTWVMPSAVTVDQLSYAVNVTYTTPVAEKLYVLATNMATSAGTSYVADYTGSPAASSGGVVTMTVSAATHGLGTFNIIARVYELSGSTFTQHIPDYVGIDASGTVTVNLTMGTSFTGVVVLHAAPAANLQQVTVAAGSTSTITITGLTSAFAYGSLYRLNGTTYELCLPDSVDVNAATTTMTVTVNNASTSPETYEFYYDYATVVVNTVRVVDSTVATAASYTNTTPQLTLWGIKQPAAVTHIDSYKREAEARVVCGKAGVLYAARDRGEVGATYLIPYLQANLNARVASNVALAPLFQPTGSGVSRTRGVITADNVSNGYAVVTGASFVSSGVVDYTLSLINMSGTLTIGSQIATTDYLTVSGMARSVHNGSFQIQSVTSQSASQVVLRVANPALTFAVFDEVGSAGNANVFTDQIPISSAVNFLPGDTISSTPPLTVKVLANTPAIVCSGVTAPVSFAAGVEIFGSRTSYVHPLRDTTNAASVANLVAGDMLTVGALKRSPRVVSVNPFHDMPVSLTVAGGVATAVVGTALTVTAYDTATFTVPGNPYVDNDPVVISSTGVLPDYLLQGMVYYVKVVAAGSTFKVVGADGNAIGLELDSDTTGSGTLTVQRVHRLAVGQRVAICQTNDQTLDGVVTISSVVDDGTFTFATTSSTPVATGVLVGRTVNMDEAVTVSDSLSSPTAVTVDTRWVPIEAPATTSTTPPTTHVTYLTDSTTMLRSCVASGNLYTTNYTDQVMKFDGTSFYQAGLPRWQLAAFAQVDTTTGSLTLDGVSTSPTAGSGNKFTIPVGDGAQFSAGDRITYSYDNSIYTVQSVQTGVASATHDYIYVVETISGFASTPTLQKTKTYYYYARLNAIDANNNIIASAATGSQDMVVELAAAGQIKWRLIAPPAWGLYDFDRVEAQLYRTVGGQSLTPPYYKIRSVAMPFSNGQGYVDIVDGTSDTALQLRGSVGDDATTLGLKGAQLGTAWEQPPRAKHICSMNNSLILANIKDYEQLDIVVRSKIATLATSDLSGFKLTLRKDSNDTGTVTDVDNRATYEFVTSGAVTITPNTDISASSTSFTVTKSTHGLVAGNWVYLFNIAIVTKAQTFGGWWQIDSATTNTFTIKFTSSYTAASTDVNRYVTATVPTNIPVWLGTDGNFSALKGLNTSSLSYESVAMFRLATAINASMTMVDVATDTTFTPWVTAHAGSEYTVGQLVLRVPRSATTFLQVQLGTIGSNYDVYVNNVKQVSNAAVSSTARILTSRVVISYPGYPELFDNPFGVDGDSVVDVNAADGEEITGIIPFFSESAFTASQVAALLVVFKTNSVYVLDLVTRQLQKVDSLGQGCTASRSIAATRNGIMFANLSGVYRLNRALTVSYVGKYIERYWQRNVNDDQIANATASNYGIDRKYKLSVPVNSDVTNSVVLVYDYTRETPAYANVDEGFGAWTRYTNHSATGWCNLNTDAFFATTDGQVYKLRRNLDATDYRDDAGAVDEMVILIKSIDGGVPGIRKHCRAVITHMRMETAVTGTTLHAATENSSDFTLVGQVVKTLDDKKVVTFRSSLPSHRFTYLSLKYTNATKDEAFVLAGVDFLMAVLGVQGLAERSQLS